MEDIDARMWAVLIALELTSNGAIAKIDAHTGGERDHPSVIPRFSTHDAPHLYYAVEYDRARDDDERERVIARAERELHAIKHSSADRTREETRAQRDQRIVEEGAGWEAIDVARKFNCGVRDIHRARQAAGRDAERGLPPVNGRELTSDQRAARARDMEARGMTARQIRFALGVSYNTVRRDLGRLD